jgi:hypothetical protein
VSKGNFSPTHRITPARAKTARNCNSLRSDELPSFQTSCIKHEKSFPKYFAALRMTTMTKIESPFLPNDKNTAFFCKLYLEHKSVTANFLSSLQTPTVTFTNQSLVHFAHALYRVSRDCSAGIGTQYELDGTGIESRYGRDFPHTSRLALRPTQSPIQCLRDLLPGDKAVRGVALTTHLHPTPRLKKE